MLTFTEIELKDGTSIRANVIAKTITALIVRTEDNKYKLISRGFLLHEEKFKFRD